MRWMFWLMVFVTASTLFVSIVRPQWFSSLTATSTESVPMNATARPADSSRLFAGGIVEGSQRDLSLRFEIAGRISAVNVDEGDLVKAGQVLAELDSELLEVRLTEARTQLKIAQLERDRLTNTGSQSVRSNIGIRPLFKENSTRDASGNPTSRNRLPGQEVSAASDVERLGQRTETRADRAVNSNDNLAIAEFKVTLAEAAVKHERLMFGKVQLRSPIDGVILQASAEPGELVGPTDERDLFTVVNRDQIRVRAFVEELDALNVTVGQRATIAVVGRTDRQYLGQVASCSPHVRPKFHRHLKPGERLDVRVREVVIDLADGSDLLIGLPVEVFINIQLSAGR